MKSLLCLATWLAVLLGPCAAMAQPAAGVVGGLRAPSLFAPECMAIPYSAVEVYDSPEGLRIGHLVLDHPEYARKNQGTCSFRPVAHFRPEGRSNLMEVQLIEVGYEEAALAVFKLQPLSTRLWVQGRTQLGQFWVPVEQGRQYLSLERDLKQGLASLSESCDEMGRCTPVNSTLQKLARRAGEERQDSCYGNAYEIEGIVTLPGGRAAYKVRLAESLEPKYEGKLPATALVPTYDFQGKWTGFFFARGC